MKKSILIISIAALITGLGSLLLVSTSMNNVEKVESERPLVLSMTASVAIPDKMEFAGEPIVFDRYDRRERMDRELNSFTYFHSTTLLLFKRANRIFPIIEPILEGEGMPNDLKYLAVIESSLDPRAVSPARAAGLWQFLQTTGREHGLEVSATVDERYHIEKSTVAASRYLKDAYRRYGSWSAAALPTTAGKAELPTSFEINRWTTRSTYGWWRKQPAIITECSPSSKYSRTQHSMASLYNPNTSTNRWNLKR